MDISLLKDERQTSMTKEKNLNAIITERPPKSHNRVGIKFNNKKMNEKLQTLLKGALADGQLTETEISVLLKKAEEYGEDMAQFKTELMDNAIDLEKKRGFTTQSKTKLMKVTNMLELDEDYYSILLDGMIEDAKSTNENNNENNNEWIDNIREKYAELKQQYTTYDNIYHQYSRRYYDAQEGKAKKLLKREEQEMAQADVLYEQAWEKIGFLFGDAVTNCTKSNTTTFLQFISNTIANEGGGRWKGLSKKILLRLADEKTQFIESDNKARQIIVELVKRNNYDYKELREKFQNWEEFRAMKEEEENERKADNKKKLTTLIIALVVLLIFVFLFFLPIGWGWKAFLIAPLELIALFIGIMYLGNEYL